MTKTAKCVDCFSANGSRSEKKCDTWAKARLCNRTLTLSNPTMLILIFRILCVDKIGSRAAAACAITSTTTTTKISAPGRLQMVDFPPPALLVYETHNEDRLRNPQRRSFTKPTTKIVQNQHGRNLKCDFLLLLWPTCRTFFFRMSAVGAKAIDAFFSFRTF